MVLNILNGGSWLYHFPSQLCGPANCPGSWEQMSRERDDGEGGVSISRLCECALTHGNDPGQTVGSKTHLDLCNTFLFWRHHLPLKSPPLKRRDKFSTQHACYLFIYFQPQNNSWKHLQMPNVPRERFWAAIQLYVICTPSSVPVAIITVFQMRLQNPAGINGSSTMTACFTIQS